MLQKGHDCESTLTRFVWAGDQLLWEMRVPGGNDVPTGSTGLDATTASGEFYGRVSYFHAGGIDKPLLITKDGVESVVPRETWRGQFHAGTSPTTGARRDCPVGTQTGCLQIAWPGMQTNAAHSWGGEQPDIRVWYGGLADGMRDASGRMYMRNRYYDPATGQFTQTDPIGLAGGLNAYGFASGDPVSYSDPYGLCRQELRRGRNRDRCPGGMDTLQYQEAERAILSLDAAAREPLMEMLEGNRIQYRRTIDGGRPAGSPSGRILLSAKFFDPNEPGYQTTGQRAFIIAHEYGHQLQRRQRRLLYLPMDLSSDIGDYFDAPWSTPQNPSPLHERWQDDANAFACHHSSNVARVNWQTECIKLGIP